MTPGIPEGRSGASIAGDIDEILLIKIQKYLDYMSRKAAPPTELAEAWDGFFRVYSPMIRAYVSAYRPADEDCGDCVQEVWGEVVSRLARFRLDPDRALFRTWLRTLARNKAVDAIRRRARQPVESLSLADEASIPSCRDIDPALAFERQYLRAKVHEVLEELAHRISPMSLRAVCLIWIDGCTVPEVAGALGLTPAQVRSRHHRAKQVLRRLLARSIPDVGGPPGRAAAPGPRSSKSPRKPRNAAGDRSE